LKKTSKKEPLFDLIKSLSRAEKRYFYIFSKQHQIGKENNYLKLFNVIIKFEVYNESKIQELVRETIAKKDFTFTKSYLYKMLLKSLNAFHKERISIDSEISELILSIEILYNKALYTQALKLCKKGIKKTVLHEKFELQLILEKWQHKILEKLNIENIEHHESISLRTIKYLNNNLNYKILSDNIYKHVNQLGVSRSEKEIKALNKLMKSPLLKTEKNATVIDAKILYNNSKALYHYFNGDFEKSHRFYSRSLQLFSENSVFAKSNPEAYISTYNNITITCLHLGRIKEIKQHIQHLKDYATNLREGQLKITTYANIFSIEIPFYINQGKFKGGLQQLPKTLDIFNQYEQQFNPIQKVFTQYFIAYLYFGNRQYNDTLLWLNNISNSPSINNREDIFVFTRIFSLITHYELGNMEFLEYQLRAIKTFLSKKERNYQLEKISIAILKDLVFKKENKTTIFKHYKPEFQKHFDNQKQIFGYFNFLAWIDMNVSSISFEKAHQKYID
jgi:hypothetical protein